MQVPTNEPAESQNTTYPMKPQYLLLLILLLLADIFAYTEIVSFIRQPSDASVIVGLLLMALLIVVNFIVIRFTLSKLNS